MADVEAARRALAEERQKFELEKRELMNELERLRAMERVGGGASSEDKEALIEEMAAFEKLKKEFLEEAKVLEDRAKRNALANETEKQLIAATRIQLDKERAMIEEERASLEAEKVILAKDKLTKVPFHLFLPLCSIAKDGFYLYISNEMSLKRVRTWAHEFDGGT